MIFLGRPRSRRAGAHERGARALALLVPAALTVLLGLLPGPMLALGAEAQRALAGQAMEAARAWPPWRWATAPPPIGRCVAALLAWRWPWWRAWCGGRARLGSAALSNPRAAPPGIAASRRRRRTCPSAIR